jgi:hypothetical protein
MFDRRKPSEAHNTLAAAAALLVVTGILSTPALAAKSSLLPCREASEATLHVHVNELTTEVVSHTASKSVLGEDVSLEDVKVVSSINLLAPRAEAAIKDAFEESIKLSSSSIKANLNQSSLTDPMAGAESQTETAPEDDVQDEADIGMNTKLPGVSDDDLSRFKKQMYRRDI